MRSDDRIVLKIKESSQPHLTESKAGRRHNVFWRSIYAFALAAGLTLVLPTAKSTFAQEQPPAAAQNPEADAAQTPEAQASSWTEAEKQAILDSLKDQFTQKELSAIVFAESNPLVSAAVSDITGTLDITSPQAQIPLDKLIAPIRAADTKSKAKDIADLTNMPSAAQCKVLASIDEEVQSIEPHMSAVNDQYKATSGSTYFEGKREKTEDAISGMIRSANGENPGYANPKVILSLDLSSANMTSHDFLYIYLLDENGVPLALAKFPKENQLSPAWNRYLIELQLGKEVAGKIKAIKLSSTFLSAPNKEKFNVDRTYVFICDGTHYVMLPVIESPHVFKGYENWSVYQYNNRSEAEKNLPLVARNFGVEATDVDAIKILERDGKAFVLVNPNTTYLVTKVQNMVTKEEISVRVEFGLPSEKQKAVKFTDGWPEIIGMFFVQTKDIAKVGTGIAPWEEGALGGLYDAIELTPGVVDEIIGKAIFKTVTSPIVVVPASMFMLNGSASNVEDMRGPFGGNEVRYGNILVQVIPGKKEVSSFIHYLSGMQLNNYLYIVPGTNSNAEWTLKTGEATWSIVDITNLGTVPATTPRIGPFQFQTMFGVDSALSTGTIMDMVAGQSLYFKDTSAAQQVAAAKNIEFVVQTISTLNGNNISLTAQQSADLFTRVAARYNGSFDSISGLYEYGKSVSADGKLQYVGGVPAQLRQVMQEQILLEELGQQLRTWHPNNINLLPNMAKVNERKELLSEQMQLLVTQLSESMPTLEQRKVDLTAKQDRTRSEEEELFSLQYNLPRMIEAMEIAHLMPAGSGLLDISVAYGNNLQWPTPKTASESTAYTIDQAYERYAHLAQIAEQQTTYKSMLADSLARINSNTSLPEETKQRLRTEIAYLQARPNIADLQPQAADLESRVVADLKSVLDTKFTAEDKKKISVFSEEKLTEWISANLRKDAVVQKGISIDKATYGDILKTRLQASLDLYNTGALPGGDYLTYPTSVLQFLPSSLWLDGFLNAEINSLFANVTSLVPIDGSTWVRLSPMSSTSLSGENTKTVLGKVVLGNGRAFWILSESAPTSIDTTEAHTFSAWMALLRYDMRHRPDVDSTEQLDKDFANDDLFNKIDNLTDAHYRWWQVEFGGPPSDKEPGEDPSAKCEREIDYNDLEFHIELAAENPDTPLADAIFIKEVIARTEGFGPDLILNVRNYDKPFGQRPVGSLAISRFYTRKDKTKPHTDIANRENHLVLVYRCVNKGDGLADWVFAGYQIPTAESKAYWDTNFPYLYLDDGTPLAGGFTPQEAVAVNPRQKVRDARASERKFVGKEIARGKQTANRKM